MTAFKVTTEQLLLRFGHALAGINVRAFEPDATRARILCFHGFSGNARDFDPLAGFLAGHGIKLVAADMFGRGDSAHFDAGSTYTLRRVVEAAAAVLAQHGQDATVLGCGWGAVIALLGLSVAPVRPRSFVSVDLRLDFSIDSDPVIAQAMADRGLTFPTSDAAIAHLRASPEFAALPAGADISHRIRPHGDGFRLSHDDAITQRTAAFGGNKYDLRAMFGALKVPLLWLNAGSAPEPVLPQSTSIGNLSPQGPLLLRSPAEHYLLLGYLLSQAD